MGDVLFHSSATAVSTWCVTCVPVVVRQLTKAYKMGRDQKKYEYRIRSDDVCMLVVKNQVYQMHKVFFALSQKAGYM